MRQITVRAIALLALCFLGATITMLLRNSASDAREVKKDVQPPTSRPASAAVASQAEIQLDALIAKHSAAPLPSAPEVSPEALKACTATAGTDSEWLSLPRTKKSFKALNDDDGTTANMLFRGLDLNPSDRYIHKPHRDAFASLYQQYRRQHLEAKQIVGNVRSREMTALIANGRIIPQSGKGRIQDGALPDALNNESRGSVQMIKGSPDLVGKTMRFVGDQMYVVDKAELVETAKASDYSRYTSETLAGFTLAWFAAMGCLTPPKAEALLASCKPRSVGK